MATTIADKDIELKMKVSRTEYLECKLLKIYWIKMTTINDMLRFLKTLDFANHLGIDDHEKITCMKKVLTDEFQDVNSEKLINLMIIVDDFYVFFITQNFPDVQVFLSILCAGIILLLKEKIEYPAEYFVLLN